MYNFANELDFCISNNNNLNTMIMANLYRNAIGIVVMAATAIGAAP